MIRLYKVSRGFTLVELMVAIVLGLLLTLGITSLFSSTAALNRQQEAMARVQENGRYSMSTMSNDLRMGIGQFCSNNGGIAIPKANAWEDNARTPIIKAQTVVLPDFSATNVVAPPTGWPAASDYPLSPRFLLQGYSCPQGTPNCLPALPAGVNVPAVGTTNGTRPAGADILTVRYLRSTGWSLNEGGSICTPAQITIVPLATDPPVVFNPGDLAMISTCGSTQVFAGAYAAGKYTPGANFSAISCPDATSEARIFNFTRDFVTVTYFLRLDTDPNNAGRLVSSLYRSVNGQAQQVVQGVERLNFLYRTEDATGAIQEMTAAQVTNAPGPTCPPPPYGYAASAPEAGCLWRAVRSVEIFMLLNTVDDMAASAVDQSFRYSFNNAGAFVGVPAPVPAPPPVTLVSGIDRGQMMRREFRSLVSVRNYDQ